MKRYSAQYVITNAGPPLKRGIVTVDDDGIITAVEDTGGELEETSGTEFHNGILIPGFVNCHCHLELSHMNGIIDRGTGLTGFISAVRTARTADEDLILETIKQADNDLFRAGVNLCGDICNTTASFKIKKTSPVAYFNFIEVFGIAPEKAEKRMAETLNLTKVAARAGLLFSVVPHSVYSLSLTLFRMLRDITVNNRITSVHFMESPDESSLIEKHSGPMLDSYLEAGLIKSAPETVSSHTDAVLNWIPASGNLILVHNTFINRDIIRNIKHRENLFFCLCPASNRYIENSIPPADILREEGCTITIGTDSLASNTRFDIIGELRLLQDSYPDIPLTELIAWATINGAKALEMENSFGTIETGKKPGLLLIGNIDLGEMKLLPESFVKRLA